LTSCLLALGRWVRTGGRNAFVAAILPGMLANFTRYAVGDARGVVWIKDVRIEKPE
jgi:hypothetical protein